MIVSQPLMVDEVEAPAGPEKASSLVAVNDPDETERAGGPSPDHVSSLQYRGPKQHLGKTLTCTIVHPNSNIFITY